MCAACSLVLDNEELYEHICFEGKTIYSNEGIIYCLSDDDVSNEESFNIHNRIDRDDNDLNDHNDMEQDDLEQEPYIPQQKPTTSKPTKKKPTDDKTGK